MAGGRLQEAMRSFRKCYRAASRQECSGLLGESCKLAGHYGKYAIRLLTVREEKATNGPRRSRSPSYCQEALKVSEAI